MINSFLQHVRKKMSVPHLDENFETLLDLKTPGTWGSDSNAISGCPTIRKLYLVYFRIILESCEVDSWN